MKKLLKLALCLALTSSVTMADISTSENFINPNETLCSTLKSSETIESTSTPEKFVDQNESSNDMESITKSLNNPVADLMQFPLEFNNADGIGPFDTGKKSSLTFKPVIPIELNEDWIVISRTIAEVVISQDDFAPGYGSQHGLGDTLQQTFFSPKKLTKNGYVWGVGPVLLLPTATKDTLGADKYAAGPTAVVLKQSNGFTRGLLAYHLWDFAGTGDKDINYSFIQPFIMLSNKKGGSISFTMENGYNWVEDEGEILFALQFKQVIPIKGNLFQFAVGPKYYAKSYENGPDGWGVRGAITWLLPN